MLAVALACAPSRTEAGEQSAADRLAAVERDIPASGCRCWRAGRGMEHREATEAVQGSGGQRRRNRQLSNIPADQGARGWVPYAEVIPPFPCIPAGRDVIEELADGGEVLLDGWLRSPVAEWRSGSSWIRTRDGEHERSRRSSWRRQKFYQFCAVGNNEEDQKLSGLGRAGISRNHVLLIWQLRPHLPFRISLGFLIIEL